MSSGASVRSYVRLLRLDYWIKNALMLPGLVLAARSWPVLRWDIAASRILWATLALCLVASSNYVLNEVLDAKHDARHPVKQRRPVVTGEVRGGYAMVLWAVVGAAGVGMACAVSAPFVAVMAALLVQGVVYNVPGLRTKEVPYLDILSESINNPLRLLAGWYVLAPGGFVDSAVLWSYWALGAYFMSLKRFAELRSFPDRVRAASYRRSFAHYTGERLLAVAGVSGALSVLLLAVVGVRHRLELLVPLPLVAAFLATYWHVAMKPDSNAKTPEVLYREPRVVLSCLVCGASLLIALWVDLPWLHTWARPLTDPVLGAVPSPP